MKKYLLGAALALLVVGAAHAQTTYNMPTGTTFYCDANGYYPPSNYGQFECRGVPLEDSTGTIVGSFFWFSAGREGANLPGVPYDPYGSITKFDYFTVPSNGNPGTVKFEWQQDVRSGSASGTWTYKQVCGGGRACWYHPILLSFSVTVNE